MRHGVRTTTVAVGACALLSGCFGSSSPEPTAAHSRTHASHSTSPSIEPTTPPTTAPTSEPTTAPTTSAPSGFTFFPPSNGPHSHNCLNISGSKPVDFFDYPVVATPVTALTLTAAAVTYADGVQVAGAWVAPATSTQLVGLDSWPPPSNVTGLNWSQRVPAAGAALSPGTSYNVFLHLRVYPDALPLKTDGVTLTFTDAGGESHEVWVDHLAFQRKC